MDQHATPPTASPRPPYRVALAVSVWGTWRERAPVALALLIFAVGLLTPRLLRRDWHTGRLRLHRNQGGTLRARAGDRTVAALLQGQERPA
jgi:hypothetical protein